MKVQTGEIYGKQTANKLVMYNVLKIKKSTITLQNIDNPLSLFETTFQKLSKSGYVRISQKPYIETNKKKVSTKKRKKALQKPVRCPYTMDFIESRADSERQGPILPDLFS